MGGLSVLTRSLITNTPVTVLPGFHAEQVLAASGRDTVALALKSGNFGSEDFFAKALDRLEAGG